jgi:AcrR family transcriptional regulator
MYTDGVPTRRPSPARDALLEAAAELTYSDGITATGVDAIAKRAGVTKRTLYQHFGSKDELVAASLAARDAPSIQALREAALKRAARTGEPPVLALFDQIERVLARSGAAGCAFLNASLELGEPDHPASQAAQHHLRAREALVAELLQASGVDDVELADELVLLLDGAFAVGATRRDPDAAVRAKGAATKLLDQHNNR